MAAVAVVVVVAAVAAVAAVVVVLLAAEGEGEEGEEEGEAPASSCLKVLAECVQQEPVRRRFHPRFLVRPSLLALHADLASSETPSCRRQVRCQAAWQTPRSRLRKARVA